MQGDRVQAFPSPIRSIALTMRERHLIVGDEEVSLSSLSWALIGPRGREVPIIDRSESLSYNLTTFQPENLKTLNISTVCRHLFHVE